MLIKIGFYLLSMVFFLIIVIILGTDIPYYFGDNWEFIGLERLFEKGVIVPMVCTILLLSALFFHFWLNYFNRRTRLGKIRIDSTENLNKEVMSFVASYFIPLVSFSISTTWRHVVALFLLFWLIGVIYIKSDIYYCNPTLLVLGYRVYKVIGTTTTNSTFVRNIIVKGEIKEGDNIEYIDIDNNTSFAFKL